LKFFERAHRRFLFRLFFTCPFAPAEKSTAQRNLGDEAFRMVWALFGNDPVNRRFTKKPLADFLKARFEVPLAEGFLGEIGGKVALDDTERGTVALLRPPLRSSPLPRRKNAPRFSSAAFSASTSEFTNPARIRDRSPSLRSG
jgi:hypothetical protein